MMTNMLRTYRETRRESLFKKWDRTLEEQAEYFMREGLDREAATIAVVAPRFREIEEEEAAGKIAAEDAARWRAVYTTRVRRYFGDSAYTTRMRKFFGDQ